MLRRVLLVLALAALAGGLAGCGAAVKSTVDPVADAATKSQQAGGFKTTIAITLASDGKQYTMTAHGTFGQQQGELDMDLSSLLRQSGMTSGLDGNLRALYLTENGDPVMYLKLGLLSAMIPGGKPWVKLDLAKAGKAAGVDLSQLMGGAGQSPTDSLQLLRSQGDFSQVGTETVGGVSTSHYHGTIDLAKAATARGASADLIKRLRDLGAPAEYPADVWIDDSGYIRRFETSYQQTSGVKSTSMSMKMDIDHYGTTVDVSAPPADQVFDATDLAAKGIATEAGSGATG